MRKILMQKVKAERIIMKEFKNTITGDILDFPQFVSLAFDEAGKLCGENSKTPWYNLTKDEQIDLFCKAYQDLEATWREIK